MRLRVRIGDAAVPQDIRETSVPITINRLWGSDLDISDQDLTLTIDRFGERYIEPGVQAIANQIDSECLDLYADVYNLALGTQPGVTPTTRTVYTSAGVQLTNSGAPVKVRALTVSPEMEAAAVEFGATLFNPNKTIAEQYLSGNMGYALGMKWSMDQNTSRHLTGTFTLSVPTMTTAANQFGSSILTTGWTASTQVLNRGDIISIVGVNSVNPISYRSTGVLRTFVVTADVVSGSGAGAATINISPPISADPTDPFQTVDALPAASASIKIYNSTVAGTITAMSAVTSPQALAFHKDAFTLAVVQLEAPGGLDWSERVTNPKIGLSMRLTRGFIMGTNRRITRLDVLGGVKTLRPELACRIPG